MSKGLQRGKEAGRLVQCAVWSTQSYTGTRSVTAAEKEELSDRDMTVVEGRRLES